LGSSGDAVEGDPVLVIGNPDGLTGTASDGIISPFREKGAVIQITAPIYPGSSGSPVLDTESGSMMTKCSIENSYAEADRKECPPKRRIKGPINVTPKQYILSWENPR
jgi:hypothetical protein